jgi:hypothetical protein
MVVRRSARTAAALLLATLKLQGWFDTPKKMVIAVDGGVVLKYQNWRTFLDQYLRELLGKGLRTRALESCCLRATGGWEKGCKRLGSSTSILWSFWLRANGGVGERVQE